MQSSGRPLKEYTCQICGNAILTTASRRYWCDECQPVAKAAKAREGNRDHMEQIKKYNHDANIRRRKQDGGGLANLKRQKPKVARAVLEGRVHCDIFCAYLKGEVSGKDDWQEMAERTRAYHIVAQKVFIDHDYSQPWEVEQR